MSDSDEWMDAFPGFSTYYHKKRDHFEQKKLIIKKEGKTFLGDYLIVSFATILRMNASP